ncbi:MAG: type II toxin-antitoxin system HicA family toxin [Verrucomicrobia bacterium]|nr:type II toxin-antitoxin system HicA family toxin [Verrucomicrobiota bacterium]
MAQHGATWNTAGRLDRIKGSHHIYGKPGERAIITVPVHGNQSLKPGLLNAVLKAAKLTEA